MEGSFGKGGTFGTGGSGRGGWYGGGGASGPGAGGGGSGHGPAGTLFETGVRTGNGLVTITYLTEDNCPKGTGRRFRRDRDPCTKTNPLRRDTDRGGVPDGREDRNRNGRVDKGETNPRKPGEQRGGR